jgi:hypothetical protein
MDQRNELQAQHLANLLWAFARVHPRHKTTRNVILALLPSCVRQIATFKPQELSSTAQAVAKAFGHGGTFAESERSKGGSSNDESPAQVLSFFNAALPCAAPNLHSFSEQSLANIVFAFSTVRIGGHDNVIFSAVEQEVLNRVHNKRLDPRDMTRLIKGLSAAPPECCGGALSALFGLVACRVDELQQQELQVLSRICAMRMGFRHSNDYLSREEIRSLCHQLAGVSCTAAVDMAQPFCAQGVWVVMPVAASATPMESREVPLRPEGIWEVPARPEGIWETPATPVKALEASEAIRPVDTESTTDEEVASVKSSGTEESFGLWRHASSSSVKNAWVCSVKNSFIHVKYSGADGESAESHDTGDGEESCDGSQLSFSSKRSMRRSSSSPCLMERHWQ